ncbi:25976_t:CDS:2 [Dentiscutata erythropus]|uniref:25976_t:CDS:1 n=1 Tax=Dentiscutata erythropus TaxID=1348616 RepID=A0A9N9BPX4_9GLOM|nr:25976_t:CDS:2 [Dentiscutata erythropus]
MYTVNTVKTDVRGRQIGMLTECSKVQELIQKIFKKHHDECNVGALEKRDSSRYREWLEKELEGGNIKNYDYSKFSDFIELGRGSHSVVYSAEYCGEKIACKKFTRPEDKILVNEIKQHITIDNNENIIEVLGITECSEIPRKNYMLVLQFANSGNLADHLRSKASDGIFEISWTELIQIAEQIISGIQHLHANKIVHRNLHPKNILINDNKVLISGFGSAWKFNDIANKLALANHISKGKREKIVPGTPSIYAKLYKKCWSTNPKKRPELKEISRKIEQSREAAKIIKNHIRLSHRMKSE